MDMKEIADLKENFITQEVYSVYAACMFEPTWEKFCRKADGFLRDPEVSVFGYRENDVPVGVIVVRKCGTVAEICGIAVNQADRGRGIGGRLIRYVMEYLSPDVLTAETDDDAVEFYRKCGLRTEAFTETYDGGECRRYRCVLRKG